MKERIVRLMCDVCSKQTEFVDNKDEYPYNKGWCFLYNFSGKIATKNTHKLHKNFVAIGHKDKHFCSVKCLSNFINDQVSSAHKTIIADDNKYDEFGDEIHDTL